MTNSIYTNKNIQDKHFMLLAYQQALIAFNKGEIPIGALLVDSKLKVISKGYNICESTNNCLLHAEILALIYAQQQKKDWRLSTETIYITLEPCIMCLGALINSRIKRIVFAVEDTKRIFTKLNTIELLKSNVFNHNPEISSGIMKKECKTLLNMFFEIIRKK